MAKKLTELCDIQYGYAFDSSKFSQDDSYLPIVRIRDVKRGYSQTFYQGEYSEEYIIHTGDLLIGMDGEFNVAFWQGGDALLNQRVCKITAKRDVNIDYLRFLLLKALKEVENRTAFATVKHLSAKELNRLELNCPDFDEQIQIANTLLKIQSLISKKKLVREKLDTVVQGRFVELFGDLKTGSRKVKLKSLCNKISDGSHNPPKGVNNSSNFMISSKNIADGKIILEDLRFLADEDFERENKRTNIVAGDVLLTIVGSIGRTAIVPDEFPRITLQRSVAVLHLRDNVNPIFMKGMLDSLQEIIELKAHGVAQKGIYLDQVRDLDVICPPAEKQEQFADFVTQVDKSKVVIQKSIDKLQLLFDSLMQQYFG